jgi:hypothetical protein
MTELLAASCRKQQGIPMHIGMARVFGFCLPVIAVILACCISFFSHMPISIEQPAILVLGSLLILVPFRSEAATTLQKIIGFYLIGVPVNELSSQYFSVSFLSVDISVSYSTAVLLLCVIAYLLGKVSSTNTPRGIGQTNIVHVWVLALAVIVVHIVLLSGILNEFYGYGYERSLSVLGNLALYFLLFVVLWKRLGSVRFRQCAGLILAIFYLAIVLANR